MFLFFHPIQSNEQTQQNIETICHQVEDYDFCKQTLSSNLKNPDASISDLNELTINLTTAKATDTLAFYSGSS
jgi:pectinesterase inhibitor-like protein